MSYESDVKRFSVKVTSRVPEVLVGVAQGLHESIVNGSPLTGAPGQPVDTGALKNSWQLVIEPDLSGATIGTNLEYAPVIEAGVGKHGPLTLRSAVGGFRSVSISVANADNILQDVVRQVNA